LSVEGGRGDDAHCDVRLRVSGARGGASAWSGGDLALALTMTRGEPDHGWSTC
jgi:hypothetical protein